MKTHSPKHSLPLKTLNLALWLLILAPALMAQQPSWQWGIRGGSNTNDLNGRPIREKVEDMATDPNGNVYIVSTVGGGTGRKGPKLTGAPSFDFYGNTDDMNAILVASYDCNGSYRWGKLLSGYYTSGGPNIATDTLGHVYVAGRNSTSYKDMFTHKETLMHFDTDTILPHSYDSYTYKKMLFLIRYDTLGNFQRLTMPQPDDVFVFDAAGSYPQDLMVEPDGTVHWVVRASADIYDHTKPVVLEGDTLSMGYHVLKYRPDGTHISTLRLPILDTMAQRPFKGRMAYDPQRDVYYLAGLNNITSPPDLVLDGQKIDNYMFVARFNSQGGMDWVRQSGPDLFMGQFHNTRPALDTEGNLYLAGNMGGYNQNIGSFLTFTAQNTLSINDKFPVLLKLSPDGQVVWGTAGEVSANDRSAAVALNGDEVVFAASEYGIKWGGITFPVIYGRQYNPYVARFRKDDGTIISMDTITSPFGMTEDVTALATDPRRNVYVGGEFESRIYVANDTLDKVGSKTNFFVAKYGRANCNCALPQAKFGHSVAQGRTVTFTYTGSANYDRLEWSFGTGTTQTTTGPTATFTYPVGSGEYWACVTAYDDSCGYDTWCTFVDPSLIGTPDPLDKAMFSYHPNPVRDGLALESAQPLDYVLYDLTGKRLRQGTCNNKSTWIPMESLQSGIYLLHLTDAEGKVATVKIVKE